VDNAKTALVLTVDPAASPVSGADLRNWQNASALSQFCRVTVASLRDLQQQPPVQGIEIVSLSQAGEKRTPSLAKRTTLIDVRISESHLAQLLRLVNRQRPDLILVEGIQLYPLLKHLRQHTSSLILDMHNIESDLIAHIPTRFSFRHLFGSNASRLRRREQEAAKLVDRIWVCSQEDRDRLEKITHKQGPAGIDIIPNGIPRRAGPDRLPSVAGQKRGHPVLLFVGHLSYPPNKDAIKRLVRRIFPRVKGAFPDAKLIVAGRYPSDEIALLAQQPDIELIANPDDLAPIYARAHLSVVPLSCGGGTRIKILEAMAFGVPVIATTVAAEGQNFIHETEILVAETDDEIVESVCALTLDPVRYESQRSNAFSVVHRRFGRGPINEAVYQALSRSDVMNADRQDRSRTPQSYLSKSRSSI